MNLAITQTRAMLVDAYRELNAKKLFWVTLILSGVLVLVFALLDKQGRSVTFAGFQLDLPLDFDRTLFFKVLFTQFGISVWLTWAATILALISTAGIIPDLISSGTVEMLVSKPVSRVRLLLTKFTFGLLFVALQVSVFSVGCFLVFGLKGVFWEPRILLAVPIVVVFYSYLFCVCVLMGLLLKSTVSALLLTLLFWLVMFIVNATDAGLLTAKGISQAEVDRARPRVEQLELATIASLEQQYADGSGEAPSAEDDEALDRANPLLASRRRRLASAEEELASWTKWSDRVGIAKTILPKTAETIGLLERSMIDVSELEALQGDGGDWRPPDADEDWVSPEEGARAAEAELRERGIWWIVGTSLVFEGVILGFACWRFAKRDF